MKQPISIVSPTRVDFCGGPLDCWPLYLLVEKLSVISLSIDLCSKVTLQPADKTIISIKSLKYQKEFSNIQELLVCKDKELQLIRPLVNFFEIKQNFKLSTSSGTPIGSGLGGSSSLCVSLVKAFCQWCNIKKDTNQLLLLAQNLESDALRMITGTQDYFAALNTGLNIIDYNLGGPKLSGCEWDPQVFKDHMSIVFTGKEHHSGLNNWQVVQSALNQEFSTMSVLKQLAELSQEFRAVIVSKNYQELPVLFKKETCLRTQLQKGFFSVETIEIEKIVLQNGADGLKVCGAGGGGCVLIWSPKNKKEQVEAACEKQNYLVLKASPMVK